MPSATPPPHSSPEPEHPTAEPPEAHVVGVTTAGREGPNPRIQAALCYAFPLLPAIFMLMHERRNGFVRFHAARSLVLFGGIVLMQVLAFVAVVILGNAVGTATSALVIGLLILAAYLVLAGGVLILWLRLIVEALAGNGGVYPYLDYSAINLELLISRMQRRFYRWLHSRKESSPI